MDQYIGRLLDNRYEILELIGTGGMAYVYKARCHRLNRLVAIKILKDEFAKDEEFRRRFQHEGEAVAMLSHPNIVQVYDVSSTDNANFIVMELIDGITLKQYMEKKGTLNWKETLHFGMQIGKALEHAHSRSIVHRDIKPHNVMVLKNGSVKVTDFGIARVMSKSNTLTKEALGSVHYISPEQAKGGWVDNRSDIYSLGVVMYEMMTGRPPYDGESPVAVAIQHINGGAPMPSVLNPNIPGGLEQIIMRAMALDTNDRYPSATELLKDMEEFRKDPGILFIFPNHGLGGETKVLPSAAQIAAAENARPQSPRTTAERVAGSGAAPASAAAAAARNRTPVSPQPQQRPRPQEQPRTGTVSRNTSGNVSRNTAGNLPRTGTSQRPASGAPRPAASEAARRAAASRTAQNTVRKTREEIREEIREEERNRAATIAIVACSAVAIIAIIIFLVALVNGALLDKGEKPVTVPNFEGEYFENIEDAIGLNVEIGGYEHHDTIEKNKVIRQEPEFGASVVQNSDVKVIISLGPEPEEKVMENLIGKDLSYGEAYLSGQGMLVLKDEEYHDTIEEGKITRTNPEAGEPLTDGQMVTIYVSKGPVIKKVAMPYVVGLNYATAKNELESYGFDNVDFVRKESDTDKDEVIDQPFARGEEIDVTTEIILTISKGPRPTEPPTERPTEKPTDPPTEAPTEAPTEPKETTKKIGFHLPTDREESYVLSISCNGTPVIEDVEIQPDQEEYVVSLTGIGNQTYTLYINGEKYDEVEVKFS